MPNLYLLTPSLLFLIIGNAFIWVLPFLLERFDLFKPQGIVGYIFCSSYWFPILFIILDPLGNVPPNVLVQKVEYAALASLCAGVGFNVAYFLDRRELSKSKVNLGLNINFKKSVLELLFILSHLIATFILIYCFIEAQKWIGVGNRIAFYALNPEWYINILPIAGYFIGTANFIFFFSDIKINNFFTLWTLLNTWFIIFVNGFDGGRRYAAIVLFLAMIGFIFKTKMIGGGKEQRKARSKKFWFLLLTSLIFMTIMSTARNALVGWNIYVVGVSVSDMYSLFQGIFSPTATLHVNTQMGNYIQLFGTQGYYNYLRAIGNTLLPEFLLGYYVFGTPLVTELHHELGWYGQDFGVLAEAIYSGGLLGAFLIHLLLGVIANKLYVSWSRGKVFVGFFYLSFIIAMLNSVRSDFMNFLKVWIYIGIALSTLYYFLTDKHSYRSATMKASLSKRLS